MPGSRFFLEKQKTQVNHLNYYYFTNAFSESEMAQICAIGDALPKEAAVTGSNSEATDYRISDISWIDEFEESEWIYTRVAELADIANKEMWNFDIWGYLDSFQYTMYKGGGGHYDWHADCGPGMSNRKLSCVLQLSDPKEYGGGELEMNIGSSILQVPKAKGNLCFFPSFLLHRVTPLTWGKRISLVTWLSGANLR